MTRFEALSAISLLVLAVAVLILVCFSAVTWVGAC